MKQNNNRRHWNESDFVVVQQGGWNEANQYGYCRKCTGDMQRLSDGILRHYNSHSWYKRNETEKPRLTIAEQLRRMENEQALFERLSKALTRGNATTWEEIIHAAESLAVNAQQTDMLSPSTKNKP